MLKYHTILLSTLLIALILKACSYPTSEQFNPEDSKPRNHVLYFDGIDDHIEIENSNLTKIIGDGDFTFEAWVQAHENEQFTHPQILSNRQIDGKGFLFGFHGRWGGSSNKIPYVGIANLNWVAYKDQPNLLDGQWHHFAATRQGDTLTYFADGRKVASFTTAKIGTYDISSNQALLIGWDLLNPSDTRFKGSIDEIRIWNRSLNEAEIKSGLSTSIKSGSTGLLGYWSFDEGSGDIVKDLSGNNYHGKIFGASWLSGRN